MKPDMQGETIKEMKFNLFIRKTPVCLIAYHNTVTRFTRVSLHKYSTVVKDKRLMDRSLWPITLVCMIANVHVNIMVKYSPRGRGTSSKLTKLTSSISLSEPPTSTLTQSQTISKQKSISMRNECWQARFHGVSKECATALARPLAAPT